MVCMNCVVSWLSTNAPSLLSAVLVPILLWFATAASSSKRRRASVPPTYGPAYLPPFVRGMMAAIKMGQDEDAFLLELNKIAPVVYLPWPLSQWAVSDQSGIERVYASKTKTLSFVPIRKEMQSTTFGVSWHKAQGEWMARDLFPVHARGLTKQKLDKAFERYSEVLKERVEALRSRIEKEGGQLEIDLLGWAQETMFFASMDALYGDRFLKEYAEMPVEEFLAHFRQFDEAFPLLAFSALPRFLVSMIPLTKRAKQSFETVSSAFAKWYEQGMPGIEDDDLMKSMVPVWEERGGLSALDIGRFCATDLWALQANAPFAAAWLMTFVLQSPSNLVDELRAEASRALEASSGQGGNLDMTTLSTEFPLAHSCIYETLRLQTSAFSIRVVENDFELEGFDDARDGQPYAYTIPKGPAKVLAMTRVAQLNEKTWKNARTWNAKRFYAGSDDSDAEGQARAKLVSKVYGFGCGVSMCEGRHLAVGELKALLAYALTAFDFELPAQVPTEWSRIRLANGDDDKATTGWTPPFNPTRPGLGVRQPQAQVWVKVSLRDV